jgi:hypothetical protein
VYRSIYQKLGALLFLALDGCSQVHAPTAFTCVNSPKYWVRFWGQFKAGLDANVKANILVGDTDRIPSAHPSAIYFSLMSKMGS